MKAKQEVSKITRRTFLQTLGAGVWVWAAGDIRSALPAAAEEGKETAAQPHPYPPRSRGGPGWDVMPTPQQLAWQEAELGMFLHFGMNTFTDREWGEGTEDPRWFNPTELDPRQWVQVAKEAGFKYLILTAKHHDGFCLWPSRYTEHSVKNSPWREGKGDVVRELAGACQEARLKMGLYLSPWDRHEPSYGTPAYNEFFKNQLTELLTQYGDIFEVWFDGAYGGPPEKKQNYDWQGYYELIRRLQPHALIAICGPDIRWVGNEKGIARETEWSVQNAHPVFHRGLRGKVWWPAECDVSIRPGWFWHRSQDSKVKSLAHLLDIYYKSVGRNAVLLLNVPPNDRGLISEPDIQRLREWRKVLDETFAVNFAQGKPATASSVRADSQAAYAVDGEGRTYWASDDGVTSASLEVDLGEPATFNVALTQEYIALGQRVEEYRLEVRDAQNWRLIAQGTTIGHKKLDRFPEVTARRVRLTIVKSRAGPLIRAFGLYRAPVITS
ncbi:MAG TPA: alpha-L-fucosidase [Armatimonadetes bacterium]|nr:alpha-L-fucosidase [Armatimonadota bacterium]